VLLHRAVEGVRDVLDDLAGLHPCHGVEFFLVGDVGCAGDRVGFYVEHLPLSRGVDPVTEDAPCGDDQAGFLEGLAYGCVLRAFTRLDLAGRELPAERAFGHSPTGARVPGGTPVDAERYWWHLARLREATSRAKASEYAASLASAADRIAASLSGAPEAAPDTATDPLAWADLSTFLTSLALALRGAQVTPEYTFDANDGPDYDSWEHLARPRTAASSPPPGTRSASTSGSTPGLATQATVEETPQDCARSRSPR
jgi:hypothetical protein